MKTPLFLLYNSRAIVVQMCFSSYSLKFDDNSYFIRDLMISSSSGSQLIDFAIGLINVIHLCLSVNSSMFKILDNWSHSSWLGLMFLLFLHVKNFTIIHMNSILHCLSHFLLIPDFSSINSLISLRILCTFKR